MYPAPDRVVIRFKSDGTFETIGVPFVPHTVISTRRISHILPVNPVKRAAFRLLRRLFGDAGKVSAWTRNWAGPWEVIMIGNGERFTHPSRAVCLAWEHEAALRTQAIA